MLQRIARDDLPGVDSETTEAIRDVLYLKRQWWLGRHFEKTGALDTDPMVRIFSGYFVKRGRVIVYVVIGEQPGPGDLDRDAAGVRLEQTTDRIRDLALRAARRQVHGALSFLPF
ncbi:hypothetical protein JXA47_04955 [Candidatus Sumerlaeota bacterium]|nr:hypothetical protein [Candidatus Sumerlaeota bacterium]